MIPSATLPPDLRKTHSAPSLKTISASLARIATPSTPVRNLNVTAGSNQVAEIVGLVERQPRELDVALDDQVVADALLRVGQQGVALGFQRDG